MLVRFLLFLSIVGCSSSPSLKGSEAELLGKRKKRYSPFVLHSEIDKDLSTPNIKLINFHLRNRGDNWIGVKNIDFVEVESDPYFRTVKGDELYRYFRERKFSRKLESHIKWRFGLPAHIDTSKWLLLYLDNPKAQWLRLKFTFDDSSIRWYRVSLVN